jgi:hypothetical protein
MIDILRDMHKWVPYTNQNDREVFDTVPVVGDQKTMERGVEAQFSISNAYSKEKRLEGLSFQLADWHHENKFLGVCAQLFFNTTVYMLAAHSIFATICMKASNKLHMLFLASSLI